MPTISKAETIAYSKKYEFSSEGAPNFRNIKEITVLANVNEILNDSGFVAGLSDLILLRETPDYGAFSINGISYSYCKLLSFESVDGDWVNLARVILTFSIIEEGQDKLKIGDEYESLLSSHWQIFNSIVESVEIARGVDSTTYTRTINASLNRSKNLSTETSPNPEIDIAKNAIKSIMAQNAAGGYNYEEYAVETQITDGISTPNFKKTLKEVYNQIENTISITETLTTTNVAESAYGHSYGIEISISEDGLITASERGRVEGLLDVKYATASSYINGVITDAKTRVKTAVNADFVSKTISLNETAGVPVVVEEAKTHNIYEGWIEYSVVFSNDPNLKDGHSYGIEINRENCDIYATENGRFFSINNDAQSIEYRHGVSHTNYLAAKTTINSRIKSYVSCLMSEPYIRTLSHDFIVGAVEYSHSFTNNPIYDNAITISGSKVKKYEFSKSVNKSVLQNSTTPILGKTDQVTQVLTGLTESEESFSVSLLLARISPSADISMVPSVVTEAKDKIDDNTVSVTTDRIKSASYDWSPYNDVAFKLDVTISTAEECE